MRVPLLLPLRIETRFHPPGPAPTELRVRVVPDEPWFDDHEAGQSEPERAALAAWRAAPRGSRREGAWRRLVDVAGAGRARWLVEQPDDPPAAPAGERIRRAVGFPRRLEIWLFADLAAAHAVIEPRLVLAPEVDALRLDFPRTTPGEGEGSRWWNSYDEAVRRGMAGRIELTDADRAALPFDCLLVVGVGDTPAEALFAGHRDTGRLAVLEPGLATNTVAGGSTPSRLADPAAAGPSAGIERLARLLVGPSGRLAPAPVIGDAPLGEPLQAALVAALWPALWGHALGNLWVTGEAVHDVGAWAAVALRPEGPLPPVRVGDQPYGILPVAPLAHLASDPGWGEPEVIGRHLVPRLLRAREIWLAAAAGDGTVVGADVDRLVDLAGRVPVSGELFWRKLVPHELALLLEAAEDRRRTGREHADWWDGFAEELAAFSILPRRRLTAVHGARRVGLPLVAPAGAAPEVVGNALRALSAALADASWTPALFTSPDELAARMGSDASVLLRLARAALQLALADDGRMRAGDPAPTLDHMLQSTPSRIEGWIARAAPTGTARQTLTLSRAVGGVARLAELVDTAPAAVERCLRGTLDCAAYRLDAWLSGPATFRLARLLDDSVTGGRLGAFGWVDDLRPGGGGPTAGGAVLAPSHSRAATAAILRDRHLRAVRDGDVSWQMNLTSGRVREARRLADAVRAGLHPAIALGLEVERLVADPERVARLRQRFPARRGDDGRRVSDGLQVLEAARTADNLWDDIEGHGITVRIRDQLAGLVDGYADLVTAEAVNRVVEGRGALSGGVLDGAAGLGPPPTLDVLQAPASRRHLTTVVIASIPAASPVAVDPRPVERADPSVARHIDERFAARTWEWSVAVSGPGLSREQVVALADLGLLPSDAVTHAAGALEALAVRAAVERTAATEGVSAAGLVGVVTAAPGSEVREEVGRRLRALGTRPFTIADLSPGATSAARDPAAIADAERVAAVLLERLFAVAGDGLALAGLLRAATGDPLERALVQARRWGIAAPGSPAAAALQLERRVDSAERALRQSAPAAPVGLGGWSLAALSTEVLAGLRRVPAGDLAAVIKSVVAPDGDLAVLAPGDGPRPVMRAVVDPLPVLDWLATVSAVRPRLAELEADLLARELSGNEMGGAVLGSTHPDDPWQLAAATATDEGGERLTSPPPMIVELRDGDPGGATALIDRFSEEVPEDRRPPSIAFGFDAPGARAPQAFLALVPPRPTGEWTPSGAELADAVLEARALARVRMALPTSEPIAALASFLPTAAIPHEGVAGVDLSGEGED